MAVFRLWLNDKISGWGGEDSPKESLEQDLIHQSCKSYLGILKHTWLCRLFGMTNKSKEVVLLPSRTSR